MLCLRDGDDWDIGLIAYWHAAKEMDRFDYEERGQNMQYTYINILFAFYGA